MPKAAKAEIETDASADPDRVIASRFLRYADYLDYQIKNAPKRTKGARTKDALKLGAIKVLDDVGYHAMRLSDICEVAGVSGATFYLYSRTSRTSRFKSCRSIPPISKRASPCRPAGRRRERRSGRCARPTCTGWR